MPTPPRLLIPLVGAHYRPPAKLILAITPSNTPLILDPDPYGDVSHQPHDDPLAVMVSIATDDVDLDAINGEQLLACGFVHEDLAFLPTIQLGYLARQRDEGHPRHPEVGAKSALELISTTPNWQATLAFAPDGKPLVRLATEHEDAN